MHIFIFGTFEVAAKKQTFDASREVRACGQDVFKRAMLVTNFPHENASVLFQDLSFDLAGIAGDQRGNVHLSLDDRSAHLGDATWAKRIRDARKSQRRCRTLV